LFPRVKATLRPPKQRDRFDEAERKAGASEAEFDEALELGKPKQKDEKPR
jgi:hypothetical protein